MKWHRPPFSKKHQVAGVHEPRPLGHVPGTEKPGVDLSKPVAFSAGAFGVEPQINIAPLIAAPMPDFLRPEGRNCGDY
jgi:hypothetical protein